MSQIVLKNGDCLDIMDELIKQNIKIDMILNQKIKGLLNKII